MWKCMLFSPNPCAVNMHTLARKIFIRIINYHSWMLFLQTFSQSHQDSKKIKWPGAQNVFWFIANQFVFSFTMHVLMLFHAILTYFLCGNKKKSFFRGELAITRLNKLVCFLKCMQYSLYATNTIHADITTQFIYDSMSTRLAGYQFQSLKHAKWQDSLP